MVIILLVIIAIGVLLLSETGQSLLAYAIIGVGILGILWGLWWIGIFILTLFSDHWEDILSFAKNIFSLILLLVGIWLIGHFANFINNQKNRLILKFRSTQFFMKNGKYFIWIKNHKKNLKIVVLLGTILICVVLPSIVLFFSS